MKELTMRVAFGLPAAVLFLLLIWVGGWLLQILLTLLALGVLLEMVRIFRKMDVRVSLSLSLATAVILWMTPWMSKQLTAVVGGALLLMIVFALVTGRRHLTGSLFCGLYGPAGFLSLYQLRLMDDGTSGLWLAIALILMIWGNDVFAYFGGRKFGRHSLAPSVSPNKTWEGFGSGFVGSLAGLLLASTMADPWPFSLSALLPAVFLVSIFGPLGDLSASRLKRLAGLKDSSRILPGHGGLLDRFDALILSAPVVYLYIRLLLLQ